MPDVIDLEQVLNAALAQHEGGHLDLAEAGYRTVLQHDPNEPDALNLLGVILQRRGELDEAIALITRALAVAPDFPEALANLARAQHGAGAFAAAAEAARRAIALDPELAEAQFQLGRTLLDLDDDAGAVAALRQAATLAPRSVETLLQLGIAQVRSGDHDAAATLTAALALAPDRADVTASLALALTSLARGHRAAGGAETAVEAARRALALDPSLADAQVELGLALLMRQDTTAAVEALRRAVEMAPGSPEALVALATALVQNNDHGGATEVWQAALALKPDDPDLLMDLATSLGELERFDEALARFRQADVLAPGHPRAQYGIALALMRTGAVPAAAEVCRRAVETTPNWPALCTLLANCEAKLGHFDAAVKFYGRTLALAPGSADALHDLVALGERLEDTAARDAVRDVLNDQSRPVKDRVAAGFTLGQVSDRDGAYDEAFTAYVLANRLQRADRAARGSVFDRAYLQQLVGRLIATIDRSTFADTAGWGDPSELPVFIVGMPRSGTTLVEQIAASHKRVFGAGELLDIPHILAALGDERPSLPPAEWDPTAVRREAGSYVQRLRDLGGDAVRIIDKMPGNILFLGQIAVLFPRARIVVCRRDPRDACLSCFFQHFQDDRMVWTDDLADCGFRARQTDRLLDHWRKVLPVPILQMQYETLVGNLETESRRLIDFLGLEWDPACLAFHETERVVHTASQWQVRQPLYASSVGRWRHYRRHLQPLLDEVAGLLPAGADADWDALGADPARALALAVPHHRAGRLDEAEPIYRALLLRRPDDPNGLHLLGLLMIGRGKPAEALALINRSLELRPDVAPVVADLARAHRAAGDAEAAVAAARHAIAVDPALPDAHVQLGGSLLLRQDIAGAVEVLRRATEMASESLEAWVTLATALAQAGDRQSAVEAWEEAVALNPDDPNLLADFAASLGALERFDEALAAYRRADALGPDQARVQYGIALCLLHLGQPTAAAEVCRQAVETTPDWAELWALSANCEAAMGHLEEATKFHRRALTLDPELAKSLHDLIVAGAGSEDDAAQEIAQRVLNDPSRPVRDRVAAAFTAGQVNDRKGAYDEAFEAFALANQLLRADRAAHGVVFDRKSESDLTDWLIATVGQQTFAAAAGWGDPSELPVFVVGMPRSGTSLVEQIAASHPLVFGAGERKDVRDMLIALGGEQQPVSPVEWDSAAVRREAVSHVQRLRGRGGEAVRVIDKMPSNVKFLGQIAMLFPRARIVVCRRDLRDTCLSCFFQYFGDDSMVWTNNLADCGFQARQINRLLDHWRKVLPLPILEIQYETLVANLESESRRLIDFLGLEWDPACLSFHETERAVLTASQWQVRQPIYASSVGRWRHYRNHLAPLLRELDGVAPADDADPTNAG